MIKSLLITITLVLGVASVASHSAGASNAGDKPPPVVPVKKRCPLFQGESLDTNRWDNLDPKTLQLTVFYDGSGQESGENPQLYIEYKKPNGNLHWLRVSGIDKFTSTIETRQYDLGDCTLTGKFRVTGVVPDGVVDGLAFGLYWTDANGQYHLAQSASNNLSTDSNFVGTWPLAMSQSTYINRTPQITDSNARHQSMAAIYGAKLLDNGVYFLNLQ